MGGMMMAAAISGGGGAGGVSPPAVSLSPANASSGGTAGGHVRSMTALPSGGDGTYTYAWTVVNPDPDYPLTINSPAAQTTNFDFTDVADGDTASAKVRCTVTSAGMTASATGFVTFVDQNTGGTGGGGGGGGGTDPDPDAPKEF